MMCIIQDDLGDAMSCGRVATSVLVPEDSKQLPWPTCDEHVLYVTKIVPDWKIIRGNEFVAWLVMNS